MARSNSTVDLSIVITAHSEGLIAHKTMLSIHEAVALLESSLISYEIIVSLDNATEETRDYFTHYHSAINPSAQILDVSFKDLSSSRNNAAQNAHGTYISFLDADDLISKNWLLDGYKMVSKSESIIVHPEYSITFGDDNLMWRKRNSFDKSFDTLCLIDNNLWDSPCIANLTTVLDYPYHTNGNGFGYEDKHFNSTTLAAGISHVIAPQTILFVRRKISGSMLRQASSDLVTVAPNQLLSYESIRSIDTSPYLHHNAPTTPSPVSSYANFTIRLTKRVAAKVHNKAKRYDTYLNLVRPLREKRQQMILKTLGSKYPNWMLNYWREVHRIDNQIFPSKDLLKHLNWYNAENIQPGLKYTRLIQSFSNRPDTLFFVPHLIKGGADMLFINYSSELKRQHPDWQIAVLQSEAKESVWKDKLSNTIDFVNLYDIFQGLDDDTQYRLLATLATQNDIQRIIIGNSQLAYDFINKYQTLIQSLGIAVYCFAFGEEFDDEGRLWGHIHTGIPRIYPVIHRIVTDNNNTVNKLVAEYAFDPERFAVHYQPTKASVKHRTHTSRSPVRVLWASRVCKQKRPDILKAVSNRLDPHEFTVDAYGQLEEGITPSYFSDSRVNYKGVFNGADSLPTENYDIYLYTSEGDGVPNVLQEMTAAGLPIVASNVGGIREFVMTGKTGFLIDDHEDIDQYVSAIKELSNPELRNTLTEGSTSLLDNQFSHQNWEANIARDFDR